MYKQTEWKQQWSVAKSAYEVYDALNYSVLTTTYPTAEQAQKVADSLNVEPVKYTVADPVGTFGQK